MTPLRIKLFMDGADLTQMQSFAQMPHIRGFTTNPTLLHKSGIRDYRAFAAKALAHAQGLPVSFEVLADDFALMEKEARVIAAWGANAYVKIPITNSVGQSSLPLIRTLSGEGVNLNITAIMTLKQVENVAAAIDPKASSVISVFAGRIADTGRDPVPVMREAVGILAANKNAELLWASPRELLNIFHAESCGCHIITATPDILNKLSLLDKNLDEFSLETVQMFRRDSLAAGLTLV